MSLPIQGTAALALAVIFGAIFGALLVIGRVANYNTIVNQFRLKDFTVLKVMLSAVVVGSIGVYLLHSVGLATYHVKSADLLGVALGAALFGVGMVIYGYCPGTCIAAVGTGSLHAVLGFFGMLLGGVAYALTFDWVQAHILSVASLGKIRLPELTGIPDLAWIVALALFALGFFRWVETRSEHTEATS